MAGNVHIIDIPIADPAGDDTFPLFKAPGDAIGGGITIQEAWFNNAAATSGGTTFTVQLLRYSSAGTPALEGTITAALGGTTDYWADNVPKEFTISDDYVDADEWVFLKYTEQTAGNPTRAHLTVMYEMGIGG